MRRITHANLTPHGSATQANAETTSLKANEGRLKDWTYNAVSAKAGDFFALAVDTSPVPFLMISAQKIPGDNSSANWQVFFSTDASAPKPINPPAVIAKDGAYAGLYSSGTHHNQPTIPQGKTVYAIIQATQDVNNGHVHLVRNG